MSEIREDMNAALSLARLKIRLATTAAESIQDITARLIALLREKPETNDRHLAEITKALSSAVHIPLNQIAAYINILSDPDLLTGGNAKFNRPIEFGGIRLVDFNASKLDDHFGDEVNAFYDWLTANPLPSDAQALWHALMRIFHLCRWPRKFTVTDSTLMTITGISGPQLDRTRNILIDSERITYAKGYSLHTGIYRMNTLVLRNYTDLYDDED